MVSAIQRPSRANDQSHEDCDPVAALRLPPATLLHPSGMLMLVLLLTALGCAPSSPDADLPAQYRDIVVPTNLLASTKARTRGAVLFQKNCVICHGERGDGRGIRSQAFSTRPRDFTDRSWRERTTPRHVYYAIREGVRDTAMPSWRSMSEQESWEVVAYILSLAEGSR